MRILIAYGSSRGSTEAIARWIADWLRTSGASVDVVDAAHVAGITSYDAIVVGAAIYMNSWHPDARHFVTRNAEELRRRPVWFFSSGPLDETALREDIPPPPAVSQLMALVRARGHQTFGGRLGAHPKGILARLMARHRAGDFRSPRRVQHWAMEIAREMRELPEGAQPSV